MVLENDVQALTKAIEALAAAVAAQTAAFGNQSPVQLPPVEEPKKETKKVEKTAPVAEAKLVAEEPTPESADVEITLQQLVAKFTDLVDLNRDAAVALLKEYSLPKLGQAKPEQYVELYNKTCELLNG